MELQKKEAQKDFSIQEICLERTYSSCMLILDFKPARSLVKGKKNNFMAPFYGWGSTASRLVPLQGGSLLFTT